MDSEQKLWKSLGMEEFRKPYKRIIEEVAGLSGSNELKIKKRRELCPILIFEDPEIENFRKLLKKFKSNINHTLKNAGEAWLFVHEGSDHIKNRYIDLADDYVPATISPLPNDRHNYQTVLINKKEVLEKKLKDHCNLVELEKVKVESKPYSLYGCLVKIEEIEKKDTFDILKFYKNFADDKSREYRSIIRELSDDTKYGRKIADDLGASTLSAFKGLSYSIASKHKHSIEPNIRGTYEGMQKLLPPLFRRVKFPLEFTPNSNILYRNKKLKVKCIPIPFYDFDQDHLYLKSYQKTDPNQTWGASISLPEGVTAKTSILNLFQTANYVTDIDVKEYPEPYDLSRLNESSAILDEEIWLWLVATRNFPTINLSENTINTFKKNFRGAMSEIFGVILPESCIKTAVEYSLVTEGFKRSFEDFCRFGRYKNSGDDNAKEFGNEYLKTIEKFISQEERKGYSLKEDILRQRRTIEKKGESSEIRSSIEAMTSIAKEIPYETLISSISSGQGYDIKNVRGGVDWTIKGWDSIRKGNLKLINKNNEKIVVRLIPGIE